MMFTKPIIDPTVKCEYVDYPEVYNYRETFIEKRPQESSNTISDEWDMFNDNVTRILSKYGKVETHGAAHSGFYRTGDCYNDFDDGCAIMNRKVFKKGLLSELQNQVRNYIDGASITLSGDAPMNLGFDDPRSLSGLDILITADIIMIHWDDCNKEECIERIRKAGITIKSA